MTHIVVATDSHIAIAVLGRDTSMARADLPDRPTCLAADPLAPGTVWCGTYRAGVFRSDDGGERWRHVGLEGKAVTAIATSPVNPQMVWVGTEPSALWRSVDGGRTWEEARGLDELPSSSEWSFPPKPDTHHVRWIVCHPHEAGRLWVAIEAGALISTADGGRTWRDRVPGGPWDTHELAVHPAAPDVLRVAAGDGYFESHDGGSSWASPMEGLEVGYLRSVAIDPGNADMVVVSASTRPRTAYVAGHSDGRVYRRSGDSSWQRVRRGWPEVPSTIAPLLVSGASEGELWAADERGVHQSRDGGTSWQLVFTYATPPQHLRGLAVVPSTR
ncbi:MAG TPA: hypothetical protein VF178_08085 [Gemmatimonadaceae bacterium]